MDGQAALHHPKRPNALYSLNNAKTLAGLDALLSGKENRIELIDYLSLNRVILGNGAFCLLLAKCSWQHGCAFETPMDANGVFAELLENDLNQQAIYYMAPLRGLVACVLAMPQAQNLGERTEQMLALLKQAAASASAQLEQQGVACAISISPVFLGAENLYGSFRRTLDHLEYRLFFGSHSGIFSQNIGIDPMPPRNLQRSPDMEAHCRLAIDLLAANNVRGFYNRVHKELLELAQNVPFSLQQFKSDCYQYLDLLCALLTQTELADLSAFSRSDVFGVVDLSGSIDELWESVRGLLSEITEQYQALQRRKRFRPAARMKLYIEENFTNVNLTVSAIAAEFHMTQPAFSAYYKQQIGTSPLSYLNQCRVQRVKELLQTTDLTLPAIATLSGFGTISTLHRVFKKETGMTPSQFRRPKDME